jgi:hypothetical protein
VTFRSSLLTAALSLSALSSTLAETSTPPGSVYRSTVPPDQRHAFFGEMHLHTTMSFDAWSLGTRITPDLAYKFGRGETVMIPPEQLAAQQQIRTSRAIPARRAWPLDFMAVTDHSENMGVFHQFDDPNNPLANTDLGRRLTKNRMIAFYLGGNPQIKGSKPEPKVDLHAAQAMRGAWDVEVKAANANYVPGRFTTFIGYEWSAMPEGKYNLHRNVFFNGDHAPMPFSSADSIRPEDLWNYLEKARAAGVDAIAIPHNGNVSGGLMYDWNDSDGRPIDEAYAQRRALNEPLTEIAQTKGQSETTPELSPDDEFANFEIFDHLLTSPGVKSKPNGSYIRQAWGRGLVIEAKVGANPYKYGVVGATDIHNGLSATSENAIESGWAIDPRTMMPTGDEAKRVLDILPTAGILDLDASAKGTKPTPLRFVEGSSGALTGVWAEENTRNAIFAALKRKETFATSGTRIRVRMFGGWRYPAGLTRGGDWVKTAYAQGVPMGSDLPQRSGSAVAPRFVLQAQKDPDGANLDRIQVIKVWLAGGAYKEEIFNVVLSNGRKPGSSGRPRPVGNTVDLKTATYANTIGAGILTAEWTDPTFDPARPAVYYARVLEIPTPRWTTILAVKNHLPIPRDVAATIQERAWTSPIWFTPVKG